MKSRLLLAQSWETRTVHSELPGNELSVSQKKLNADPSEKSRKIYMYLKQECASRPTILPTEHPVESYYASLENSSKFIKIK